MIIIYLIGENIFGFFIIFMYSIRNFLSCNNVFNLYNLGVIES